MTLEQFRDGLNRDLKAYNDFRAENALIAGQDLIALSWLRIQETGQDYDLESFDPYSPEYAENRQKNGYQTEYKDYTRTGKLRGSILPIVTQQDSRTTTVQIAANNDGDNDKLRGAYSRGDELLRGSEEDLDIVFDAFEVRLREKLPTLFG